jgi:hypothetical protein
LPDRQVIAAAIPPEFIVGAIKISDEARFLPTFAQAVAAARRSPPSSGA